MPEKLDRGSLCDSWAPYVRCLADAMGLKDWTVGLSHGHPPDDSEADVLWTNGTKSAAIRVGDNFLSVMPEDEQRETVVHELVHCHFEPARVIAERAMGDRWEDFRMVFEMGIDGIAQSWARTLPLPSQVSAKDEESDG